MTEWRCSCGLLLGIRRGNAVEVTFPKKGTRYTIVGRVTVECGRCGITNESSTN